MLSYTMVSMNTMQFFNGWQKKERENLDIRVQKGEISYQFLSASAASTSISAADNDDSEKQIHCDRASDVTRGSSGQLKTTPEDECDINDTSPDVDEGKKTRCATK